MPIYHSKEIDRCIISEVFDIDKVTHEDQLALEKHLCLLFDAIKSIPKKYYEEDIPYENGSLPELFTKKNKYLGHVERAFAYELYHRWSCLLCGNNDGFMLNGEIGKYLKWFYDIGYDDNGYQKYPDIVLHKGQTENGQMIVCEIKRMDHVSSGIVEDLNKLCRFTRQGGEEKFFNPYHFGGYIITNVERKNENENKRKDTKNIKKEWEKEIANIIRIKAKESPMSFKFKLYPIEETTKKIICVYSHWDSDGNHSLSYQSLYNILSSNKNFSNIVRKHIVDGRVDTIRTEIVDADNMM